MGAAHPGGAKSEAHGRLRRLRTQMQTQLRALQTDALQIRGLGPDLTYILPLSFQSSIVLLGDADDLMFIAQSFAAS